MTTSGGELPTFGLNHPKNYFGVPIALAADGDTGGLVMGHLVKTRFGVVRRGATELGLVTDDFELTPLGEEVAEFAVDTYGDHEAALAQFRSWKGTQTRFIELNLGEWGPMAARTIASYEPASRITRVLVDRNDAATLPEFITDAAEEDRRVVEMFVKEEAVHDLEPLDGLTSTHPTLADPSTYRSKAVSHFKSVLYHCGVLTAGGRDSTSLDPTSDEWRLDTETGCVSIVLGQCESNGGRGSTEGWA